MALPPLCNELSTGVILSSPYCKDITRHMIKTVRISNVSYSFTPFHEMTVTIFYILVS